MSSSVLKTCWRGWICQGCWAGERVELEHPPPSPDSETLWCGRGWEALPSVGNQNRTKRQEADSARMSPWDLWADAGLRINKLRKPRTFVLGGSSLCTGHVEHPHWGGLHGESHSLMYIHDVNSILCCPACSLIQGLAYPEAASHLLLLTLFEHGPAVALAQLCVVPRPFLVTLPHPKS